MRIGLIGYGKMGKAIERIALGRGHTISFLSDSKHPLSSMDVSTTDVAIEFTQPGLAVGHMKWCLEQQLPVVVGTTAWQSELPVISELVTERQGSLLYASNFSIGVNILFQLNERLAQFMSHQPEYSASIEEIHHVQKLDAPSGTAVTIADGIIQHHDYYTSWVSETGVAPHTDAHELPITALREPNVPGTHTISYTSTIDTLTLTHIAHSRDGFALGAVLAAEFLVGKTGLFTMRDVLSL